MTLRARSNHPASFAFELEEPGSVAAPLVPSQPLFLFCFKFFSQLRPHNILKLFCRNGRVVVVRVHLDQLEVSSVEISAKEVIIELQHPQPCQLIDLNSTPERSPDCVTWFSTFQLVRLPDFVQITEVGASQGLVNNLFVFGVDHVCLLLQSFDELPLPTVSQKFENLCKQRLAFFHVSCSARLCHLLHKPVKDLAKGIVDRSVDSIDHRPVFHVSAQKRGVHQQLFGRKHPHQFFSIPTVLPSFLQVVMHVLQNGFVRHLLVVEERAHLFELWPKKLWDLNIHFCESEPGAIFQIFCQFPRRQKTCPPFRNFFLATRHFSKHG